FPTMFRASNDPCRQSSSGRESPGFGISRPESEATYHREKSDGDEDLGKPDEGQVKPRHAKDEDQIEDTAKPEKDAADASPDQHSAQWYRLGYLFHDCEWWRHLRHAETSIP